MAYKKHIAKHVWGHNSTILAPMQLYERKGISLIVEELLGVQIIHIWHTVFELCMREKKERRKENKIYIFMFNFLNYEKD